MFILIGILKTIGLLLIIICGLYLISKIPFAMGRPGQGGVDD